MPELASFLTRKGKHVGESGIVSCLSTSSYFVCPSSPAYSRAPFSYISTYIGRPCSIYATDYDTLLPDDYLQYADIFQHPTGRPSDSSSSLSYVSDTSHTISRFPHRAILSACSSD